MMNNRYDMKQIGLFFLLLSFAIPSSSQKLVLVTDPYHSIRLQPGTKIAYLQETDSIRLANSIPAAGGETTRHGIIFKTGRISFMDTTSIYLGQQTIPYKEIRYVYVNKKYLGAKIPGVAVMAFSAAILVAHFRLTKDVATPLFENNGMFFGFSGLLLGGYFTFRNYNPLLKADYAPLRFTVVY